MARAIMYNNSEISLMVFTPNITTNHAITYTNWQHVPYHVLEHVFYTMRATNLTHLSWCPLNYCQNLTIRYKIKPL